MNANNTVTFKLDPKQTLPLTSLQRQRLSQLAARSDAEIDYSDIAASTPSIVWTRPQALVSNQNKQQVTLRLDADVLTFFKQTGKRYQSRINAALREYVGAHRSYGGGQMA